MYKILPKRISSLYYANFYKPKSIQTQAIPELHFMKESPVAKNKQINNNKLSLIKKIINFFKLK